MRLNFNLAIVIVLVLTAGFHTPLGANENTTRFIQANQFYQEGEFQAALEHYQAILKSGYENGPLYYNIGNCYYKLNDAGHAILNYERALKFMPNDEDLKTNLALTKLNIVDQITPRPNFILFRIVSGFLFLLPQSVCFVLLAFTYVITMIALIARLISRNRGIRHIYTRISLFSAIFCILILFILVGQWQTEKNRIEGIIMAPSVDVKGSPSDSGVDVFTLHTGTKVRLDQTSGDWTEIVLEDGKVGWIKKEVLEII